MLATYTGVTDKGSCLSPSPALVIQRRVFVMPIQMTPQTQDAHGVRSLWPITATTKQSRDITPTICFRRGDSIPLLHMDS